jgi:hypothetical protein
VGRVVWGEYPCDDTSNNFCNCENNQEKYLIAKGVFYESKDRSFPIVLFCNRNCSFSGDFFGCGY